MKANKLRLFSKDISGQISIMAVFLIIPLTVMIGAGVDWALQVNTKSRMQSAIDSAILAVARATQSGKAVSNVDRRAIAANIIDQNLSISSNVVLNDFEITYVDNLLKITHTARVKTNFLKLLDVASLDVSVTTELKMKFGSINLALAVDLSGSMVGSKLSELKKATIILLNELEKTNAAEVRVSFIPWTLGVNVGNYYADLVKETVPVTYEGTCVGTKLLGGACCQRRIL